MGRPRKRGSTGDRHRPRRKRSGACGHQHVRLAEARVPNLTTRLTKRYTLIGADGAPFASKAPGTLGGHRKTGIYGCLDCRTALRAISKGGYVKHRVFFLDEASAVSAGYRPCAVCMPERYARWEAAKKSVATLRPRRGR